jgi:chemotaxis protein MotB
MAQPPPAPPEEEIYSVRSSSPLPWLLLVVVLAGAGYASYWGYGERNRLIAEGTAGRLAASQLQTEKIALAERVQRLEAERNEARAAREALARNVEAQASQLAELKGTYDKLQEKMKEEIARGDIQLTESGGKLRVGLVDKILFDSGEARVSKRGEGVLARVGAVLAAIDDRQVQVSGHTDNAPISDKLKEQFPTNWELSTARATNVVRFLAEKAAVPPQRLLASGHGEYQPIASNRTGAGRARNRRIEILLTPSLAPQRIPRGKLVSEAEPHPKQAGR